MRIARSILFVLLLLFFAGCGGGGVTRQSVAPVSFSGPGAAGDGSFALAGIEGEVMATTFRASGTGIRTDRRPLSGVSIRVEPAAEARTVARIVPDTLGRFRIYLPPGVYLLIPPHVGSGLGLLTASAQRVSVSASGLTRVRIEYQSQRF